MRVPPALLPLAALLAAFLAAPLVAGVVQTGLADWRGVDIRALASAGLVSVASASLATLIVGLLGIPLGYVLARVPGRAMALLGFVVQLPLALPPLASGVLLLFLFGYASPLGLLTRGALTDSFAGIVAAEAFVAAPFLIVAARSAFGTIDPALEDVAATLGHTPSGVFRRVSLALALPGIGAGLLLSWLRAFGEFGATVMVAYHPYTLPVYTYVAFGSEGLPAMLPILLPTVLIAAAVMALSLRVGRSRAVRHETASLAPLAAPMPAAAAVSARPLDLAFRQHFDGFTLDVAWQTDARRLCILGASGSGKSATLRLMAGLRGANRGGVDGHAADRAAFTLDGRDLAALPAYRRGIGYVPQNYGLLPHLAVAEQIRFGRSVDPVAAERWTRRLGLQGLEHRRPAELSLGQQQRVALARALSCRSGLLLLDEPFAALDAALRTSLCDEMAALQAETDATTVLVTHDPAEASRLADEVLLLENGRVLQAGPIETVFLRPASEAAARLMGASNMAAGHVVRPGWIDIGGVGLAVVGTLPHAGPVGWAVRPSNVRVTTATGTPATLVGIGPVRSGQRRLTVRIGAAVLHAMADPGFTSPVGECRVSIDPASIQVWPVTPTTADAHPAPRKVA